MLLREVNMLTHNAVFQCLRGVKPLSENIPRMTMVRCYAADHDRTVFAPEMDFDSAKPFADIPHFKILPFIGTYWTYMPVIGRFSLRKQHLAMKEKQRTLGNIYREKVGRHNLVWLCNADDGQILFRHEGNAPSRKGMDSLRVYRESRREWYTSIGVLVLQGKEWRDLRSKVQQHFMRPEEVHQYLYQMQDVTRDFVDKIYRIRNEKHEVPDFLVELYKWGLESVAYVGLDTRLGCLDLYSPPDSDGMKMIKSVQVKFELLNKFESVGGSLPIWKYLPTPSWRRFTKAADVFTVIAYKHINQAFNEMKKKMEEGKENTLIHNMLTTKGLDPAGAMVTVADLMMGGIDTTSHAVGFFLYHLARNPEKQEMVYQEIMKVLPSKEDRITTPIYKELRYLKACLKETLRLNPVFNAVIRDLDHDVVLSGYRIPAGTLIVWSIYSMCTDERYFTDPLKFLPERWSNKDERYHPHAFLPFGYGVRSCLGRRVAELEITCLIAELLRHFRVEYRYEDMDIHSRLVNTPDQDLKFNFIERQ